MFGPPRFNRHPDTTPSPWLVAIVAASTHFFIISHVVFGHLWVAVLGVVVTQAVVGWRVFDTYRRSYEGMITGIHPDGARILEHWHRETFCDIGDDTDVEVRYGWARKTASTRIFCSSGVKKHVTFIDHFVVCDGANAGVAVCDAQNGGPVHVLTGACGARLARATTDWVPVSIRNKLVDITPAVQKAHARAHTHPYVFAHNPEQCAHVTVTYTTSSKDD